jgi:hypothetical protein
MRKLRERWRVALVVLASLPIVAIACRERPPEPAPSEYTPTATIKDLMLSLVDPSADVVWNAVSSVSTASGLEENVPRSDEEWALVRQAAIRLVEAPNLLVVPGRHVARPGEKSIAPGIELEPPEIEALINRDRPAFAARAKALHDVALEALQAIDARDTEKLLEVGGRIEQSCENCHMQYWYPGQKIPDLPPDLQPYGK